MELAVECLTPVTVPQYSRSRINEVMPSLESPSCSFACIKKKILKPHCCSRFGNRLLATPSFISTRLVALMQARHLEHLDITNRLLTDRVRLLTTSVRKTAFPSSSLRLCRLQTKFHSEEETSSFHVAPRVFVHTKSHTGMQTRRLCF